MSVTVEQVEGRRGVASFIDVAWRIQGGRGTPWIPPLRVVVRDLLDRKGNPFYRDAERALFIARKGGTPVGRIAAVENRAHNRHHADRVGFFGFFETEEDPEVVATLLEAADGWLRGRGLTIARGPISPSMNHESGLLVAGFEVPPALMTPWNPPYYAALLEQAGCTGVQDLLAYSVPAGGDSPFETRLRTLAERTLQRTHLTFRDLRIEELEDEARAVHSLYCDAWEGNWGFVPPSWEEFWHSARELKPLLDPRFSFVAEAEGEIVGFMMIARDLNRVLARVPDGRLWPWNVVRILRGVPRILSGRIVLLGLRAHYRNRGLFPLFAFEAARRGAEIGAEGAEASWILDGNAALTGPLEAMGLQPHRRWRIYERPIRDLTRGSS